MPSASTSKGRITHASRGCVTPPVRRVRTTGSSRSGNSNSIPQRTSAPPVTPRSTSRACRCFISVPYYLNLAPNYDDTLTPRYLSKRGWQLQNEFRYLTPRAEGKLDIEALPNDRMENR